MKKKNHEPGPVRACNPSYTGVDVRVVKAGEFKCEKAPNFSTSSNNIALIRIVSNVPSMIETFKAIMAAINSGDYSWVGSHSICACSNGGELCFAMGTIFPGYDIVCSGGRESLQINSVCNSIMPEYGLMSVVRLRASTNNNLRMLMREIDIALNAIPPERRSMGHRIVDGDLLLYIPVSRTHNFHRINV